MERNEKQQISVKTINIFNIISFVINGPKGTLHKAAFNNIFIKATCVCKHEIINFMKLDKIWEIWEVSEKDMRQNMGFMGNIVNMEIMVSVDTLFLANYGFL